MHRFKANIWLIFIEIERYRDKKREKEGKKCVCWNLTSFFVEVNLVSSNIIQSETWFKSVFWKWCLDHVCDHVIMMEKQYKCLNDTHSHAYNEWIVGHPTNDNINKKEQYSTREWNKTTTKTQIWMQVHAFPSCFVSVGISKSFWRPMP